MGQHRVQVQRTVGLTAMQIHRDRDDGDDGVDNGDGNLAGADFDGLSPPKSIVVEFNDSVRQGEAVEVSLQPPNLSVIPEEAQWSSGIYRILTFYRFRYFFAMLRKPE